MTSPSLPRSALRVAAATALLLLLPLVAMRFTDEMAWGPGDFIAAAALLFGAGMAVVLALRRIRGPAGRVAVTLAIGAVLATVWAELAVGLFH